MTERFWEQKSLHEMSRSEWESLCDGCALCCLHKLQDDDTDEVYYTDVHCRYMDKDTCRCGVYENRAEKVPNCIWLTADQAHEFHWLPATCAYRLIAEKKPLAEWHPLISGNTDSVHKAGVSMRRRGIADNLIDEQDWQDRIIWKA